MKKIIVLLIILSVSIAVFAQHYEGMKVYIWDNDAGRQFQNPDNPEKFIGYEQNLINAFQNIGFDKQIVVSTDFPANPEEFAAIFVVCGDRPAEGVMFKDEQLEKLRWYLETWHGCLYMEGNNIIEDMNKLGYGPEFLKVYFNILMTSPGEGYAGYDTIRTDTSCTIFRDYSIVYPAGTPVDYHIDEFGPSNPEDTSYHSVMVYDAKQKMYKSTAAAYTPPDEKKAAVGSKFKTYLSAVDFGAYAAPHRKYEQLPDSTENQLLREAYLRDIMRLFSIGKILIVNHSENPDRAQLIKSLDRTGIPYENVYVAEGTRGLSYAEYGNFLGVIWYSMNNKSSTMLQYDIDQLSIYMDYGGAVMLSGPDILSEWGYPEQDSELYFFRYYFGVDYLGGKYTDDMEIAEPAGMYGSLKDFKLFEPAESDVMKQWRFAGTAIPATYHYTSVKAPALSGITYDRGLCSTGFFSYPVENIADDFVMDTFSMITAEEMFGMDMLFALHTGINDINVSYALFDNAVEFTVNINDPDNGIIVLERNGKEELTITTSQSQGMYRLKSSNDNGLFVINYYENNFLVNSFSVSISGKAPMGEKVYMANNTMYIESQQSNTSVHIYDITGQFVDNIEINGKTVWKAYGTMPSGIYFVKFIDSGNMHKVLKY